MSGPERREHDGAREWGGGKGGGGGTRPRACRSNRSAMMSSPSLTLSTSSPAVTLSASTDATLSFFTTSGSPLPRTASAKRSIYSGFTLAMRRVPLNIDLKKSNFYSTNECCTRGTRGTRGTSGETSTSNITREQGASSPRPVSSAGCRGKLASMMSCFPSSQTLSGPGRNTSRRPPPQGLGVVAAHSTTRSGTSAE